MSTGFSSATYKPLAVKFDIPENLASAIDAFLDCINKNPGKHLEDCYRTEIDCELRWCIREHKLTSEQCQLLRDYYVNKKIYTTV